MNRNVILLTEFSQVYLLTNSLQPCRQVMDFHFLVMEKSWKINVEKEGAPWILHEQLNQNIMCLLTLQVVLLLERVLEKIQIRFIIWVGCMSSVSYCYTSIIGFIPSHPPPFTRCRVHAQVDHVMQHAGQLFPFVRGVKVYGCVIDLVLGLGWLILFYETVFHFQILCSITLLFSVWFFYNKVIISDK